MTRKLTIILPLLMIFLLSAHGQSYKMSSMLRRLSVQHVQSMRRGVKANDHSRVTAFVRSSDAMPLRDNGCYVLATFDDIYIASIPVNRLRSLAADSRVQRIEAGRTSNVCLVDAASMVRMPEVWNYGITETRSYGTTGSWNYGTTGSWNYGTTESWNYGTTETRNYGTTGFKGAGIVMGIMDVGFDLTNPVFRDADGRLRIKALWDQLDRTDGGSAVTGIDTTYVGRQYTDEASLLALGHSYDGFMLAHGTHTTGIAAGRDQKYCGMAPEADICLVCNAAGDNADSIPANMRQLYNATTDALGFKYIFDYADSQGKPCVISFSEGAYPDLYGGDQLYAEVLSKMLGPGHILCASAGNESLHYCYVDKPLGMPQAGAFVAPSVDAYYTLRSSDKMTLRLTFYPPKQQPVVREIHTDEIYACEDSILTDTFAIAGIEHALLLAAYPSCYNAEEVATELLIQRTDAHRVGSDVPVSITLLGDTIHAEAIASGGYFTTNALDDKLCQIAKSHNVHTPAGLPRVICVGSVNSTIGFNNIHDKWQYVEYGQVGMYSTFSSVGPSMCGLQKPDVSAPGSLVISAYNSFYSEKHPSGWDTSSYEYDGRKYFWHADCGTSMSAPVVGGIIATWLQACPTLTPEQVMEVIAATSSHPDASLSYPNIYYGHGIIDAKAGLDYVLSHFCDDIKEVNTDTGADHYIYDLQGRRITNPKLGSIYIRNGKKHIQK